MNNFFSTIISIFFVGNVSATSFPEYTHPLQPEGSSTTTTSAKALYSDSKGITKSAPIKKLILSNYDYGEFTIKIKHGTNGERSDSIILYGNNYIPIKFNFDYNLEGYTYNGSIVKEISLNNGGVAENIIFNANNGNITYSPFSGETQIILKDYKKLGSEKFYSIIDPTGISGREKNAIIETLRENDDTVKINIKKWGSKINTTNTTHHFLNGRGRPGKLKIINNYHNIHEVKVRLRDALDKSYRSFPIGGVIDINRIFKFDYSGPQYYLKDIGTCSEGAILLFCWYIQEMNFFGKNYVDSGTLKFEWSTLSSSMDPHKNYIVSYKPNNNYPYEIPIIDSSIGFIHGTVDSKGIAGGPENVQIDAYVEDVNTLVIEFHSGRAKNASQAGTSMIESNYYPNQCITASTIDNTIKLSPCNDYADNQRWTIDSNGSIYITGVDANLGQYKKCWSVEDTDLSGYLVVNTLLSDCTGSKNQTGWINSGNSFEKTLPNGAYYLIGEYADYRLSLSSYGNPNIDTMYGLWTVKKR